MMHNVHRARAQPAASDFGGKEPAVSVIEELRSLEQRVAARLAELQPLIEEYEELRRIADRLGLDVESAVASPNGARRRARAKRAPRARSSARKATASTSSRRRPGGTRSMGAERRARILELVRENPGITVRDVSKELGVDPPPIYRVVRKLQAEGVITKEGTSLRLAE
jgi:transposase-like protein